MARPGAILTRRQVIGTNAARVRGPFRTRKGGWRLALLRGREALPGVGLGRVAAKATGDRPRRRGAGAGFHVRGALTPPTPGERDWGLLSRSHRRR
jgi:hypothetical protein